MSSSIHNAKIITSGDIKHNDKSLKYVCEDCIIKIVYFHEDGWDSRLDDVDIIYKLDDIIKKDDLYFKIILFQFKYNLKNEIIDIQKVLKKQQQIYTDSTEDIIKINKHKITDSDQSLSYYHDSNGILSVNYYEYVENWHNINITYKLNQIININNTIYKIINFELIESEELNLLLKKQIISYQDSEIELTELKSILY